MDTNFKDTKQYTLTVTVKILIADTFYATTDIEVQFIVEMCQVENYCYHATCINLTGETDQQLSVTGPMSSPESFTWVYTIANTICFDDFEFVDEGISTYPVVSLQSPVKDSDALTISYTVTVDDVNDASLMETTSDITLTLRVTNIGDTQTILTNSRSISYTNACQTTEFATP